MMADSSDDKLSLFRQQVGLSFSLTLSLDGFSFIVLWHIAYQEPESENLNQNFLFHIC